ncbi:MAG: hypothetical protein JWO95_807, partial [Verrucomicrobiales bacterium]|nr:hypothetical protein [Verrucomicrobiales bacterium]
MRPKFVWSVIAAAVLLLGIGYLKFRTVAPPVAVEMAQPTAAVPTGHLYIK